MPGFGALVEQQRIEGTIARIRWGAVALALVLGPTFPNLYPAGVFALGLAVAAYNVLAQRLSARAATLEQHRRIGEVTFGADLAALSVAMFLFSADPYWTTFFIGTLVIIGGAVRFGSGGAYTSAVVLSVAYIGITVFRARAFGIPIEPQRSLFHLSVFALTALLIDRVLRDVQTMRDEREDLISLLERRIGEDAALATALRVVARGPKRAPVPDVLEACRGVFQFDRATVFVEDMEAGEYTIAHRLSIADDLPPPRLRLGEGLVGSALASGRTILLGNVLEDPRYRPRPGSDRPRSLIIVPLFIGGRASAALSLSRSRPDAFGPDDVRLAEIIGGLIAQVIENERLFAEASEAEALREMDRLKDEFLAAVSHDLRTPLTVIGGSLELLAKDGGASPERNARLIDQAERHVRRLNRMVEDLLTLAQLQEARIELEREFVSPGALLADVALTHEPVATTKGQSIQVVCEDGLPPILVDRRRMAQALGDLVDNASRYAPDGTAIEMRAEHDGDGVRLAVVDEGPGVPAEERERVFDKFYRGSRTKSVTTGTGLGLAIARSLVEMHGGRIRVEDATGRGARFVVTVPHETVPALAIPE